ncbi:hypothetical protein K469DRAFT_754088 [Zopfia rhizophila CBS 207.26]|uniref:GPI anchored protein n=1 Tax=Zopfia rhizophila CBS 207.26 TaxID=1314779 RepID=A0A6A6DMZ4_9PEZI|nr:hypothetical protein K469DRAFT_754088 [Zopfia rhizophila CBS 207.26]
MYALSMRVAPALAILASTILPPVLTQATTVDGFMTIQTIDVPTTSPVSIPRPLTGPSESNCIEVCTGESACNKCNPTTPTIPVVTSVSGSGGQMSILPISTSVSITLPEATSGLLSITGSATGIVSIPSGEVTVSTDSPPAQSTGAAPHQSIGDGGSLRMVMAVSVLSVLLGVAWTLL